MKEVKLLDKLYPETSNPEELETEAVVDQTTSSTLTQGAIDFAEKQIKGEAILIPEKNQKEVRENDRFVEYVEETVEKGVIGRVHGMTACIRPDIESAYIIAENPTKTVKILLTPN